MNKIQCGLQKSGPTPMDRHFVLHPRPPACQLSCRGIFPKLALIGFLPPMADTNTQQERCQFRIQVLQLPLQSYSPHLPGIAWTWRDSIHSASSSEPTHNHYWLLEKKKQYHQQTIGPIVHKHDSHLAKVSSDQNKKKWRQGVSLSEPSQTPVVPYRRTINQDSESGM